MNFFDLHCDTATEAMKKRSVQDGELPKELLNRTAASHQKWWLAAV